MSEVMIGGELINLKSYNPETTKGEQMDEPIHAPDEFIEAETEFTDADIEKELQSAGLIGSDEKLQPIDNSIFANLVGYEPKPIEEKVFGPKVLKGKYNAVITRFERRTGTWPSGDEYDNYQCNVQIVETVDAQVDGNNMYVNRDWNLKDTQFKTGAQSIEDMLNELNQFVTDIQVHGSTPDEIFECIDIKIAALVGETVTIRVWPQTYKKDYNDKKKGDFKTDKNGYVKHSFAFASRVNLNADFITD
jgi:hypothetical protein